MSTSNASDPGDNGPSNSNAQVDVEQASQQPGEAEGNKYHSQPPEPVLLFEPYVIQIETHTGIIGIQILCESRLI